VIDDKDKDIERALAESIVRDFDIDEPTEQEIAAKFAPRDTWTSGLKANDLPGKKRIMGPTEHLAESIATLNKALGDAHALVIRLLGESPAPPPKSQPETKKPVITQLHDQATEVARIAAEMSAVVAKIRDVL